MSDLRRLVMNATKDGYHGHLYAYLRAANYCDVSLVVSQRDFFGTELRSYGIWECAINHIWLGENGPFRLASHADAIRNVFAKVLENKALTHSDYKQVATSNPHLLSEEHSYRYASADTEKLRLTSRNYSQEQNWLHYGVLPLFEANTADGVVFAELGAMRIISENKRYSVYDAVNEIIDGALTIVEQSESTRSGPAYRLRVIFNRYPDFRGYLRQV